MRVRLQHPTGGAPQGLPWRQSQGRWPSTPPGWLPGPGPPGVGRDGPGGLRWTRSGRTSACPTLSLGAVCPLCWDLGPPPASGGIETANPPCSFVGGGSQARRPQPLPGGRRPRPALRVPGLCLRALLPEGTPTNTCARTLTAHPHTLGLFHTHAHPHTLTHTLALTHTLSHSHTHALKLTHSYICSHPHTCTRRFSFTLPHTSTHTHIHSDSHTHTQARTFTHRSSLTSHTLTQAHTLMFTPPQPTRSHPHSPP